MQAYSFGEFTLDVATRELRRDRQVVHLSPKAFQLLELLVRVAPRAVSKAELQDRLWPDTYVVEANLQHLAGELRAALQDDPRDQRYLRTVRGFGYAFHSAVVEAGDGAPLRLTCRLLWPGGRATLPVGAHVVGRDEAAAAIVIDSASVSRRHARLRVEPDAVLLEDLGSKNGTFVGERRIGAPVVLADGDRIAFGCVPATVRITATPATTETAATAGGV